MATPSPGSAAPPAATVAPARRTGRWIAAGALGLVALLLCAAWFGPGLLDWNAWRPAIAELASTRLGRPVALGGRITLALLPQPRIEAADVTLGQDGDGLRVDARALRLRLDLGALLSGRLELREIVIVDGHIRLPWPPVDLPSFRPPPWLGALDARLEHCRLQIGGVVVEGLDAQLVTGGVTEALVADGSFTWRNQPVRFTASLGRAGFDGAAPLELGMAAANATVSARGVLAAGGGFEGRMEAAGTDLSTLLPAPALAFRAAGRLTATEEVIAGVDLGLELGGQPARGAVSLRLVPEPRLEIALTTGRLDLDAWTAAVRGVALAGGRAVPVVIDLSAEATALGPLPIRRLRGAFFLDGERLTLSDVSGVLPGGTEVDLAGATAGRRLELALRFASTNLRETLIALGLPLDGLADPARLRQADGRARIALQEGQATISDLVLQLDGAKLTGNGVVRPGPRPSIGLGLAIDSLDLDGLLPAEAPDWPALPARLAGFDLNLRLSAEQVRLAAAGTAPLRRAVLDATLENGRLALRRLGFRLAEMDVALTGAATLAGGPVKLSDLVLELGGTAGDELLAPLLPAAWLERLALPPQMLVALRLAGGGTPDALALRAEGDLGELRLEAQGTLDLPALKGASTLTLRHPGAPRVLAPLLGESAESLSAWLGQGSLALIGSVQASRQGIVAEKLDIVAAALRARGELALALSEVRPRLTGTLAAERLPLPDPTGGPVAWQRLGGFDAELALTAGRVEIGGAPALEEAEGRVVLGGGALRLEGLKARLGGGALEGALAVGFADPAAPPRITLEAKLADAAIAAPLLGLPFDLGAGRVDLAAKLEAQGHGRDGIAATLAGTMTLAVKDGLLSGYDLAAVQAAATLPGFAETEAALRRVLSNPGGGTAFERLEARASIADGVARLEEATLATEAGSAARAEGRVDIARGALDLLLSTTPVAEAPPVGLRLFGPAAAPRRQPELAPFLRWKAQQG